MHGSNAQAAAQELLRIGCHAYSKFLRVSSSGCKILVLPNKAANAMADAVAAREVRERRLISFGPSPRRIARGGRPFIVYYKKGAVRQGLAEVTKIGGLFFWFSHR